MNQKKHAAVISVLAAAAILLSGGCEGNGASVSSALPVQASAPVSTVSSGISVSNSSSGLSYSAPPVSSELPEADPSCLDDAVFIGDSITLKLKNYVTLRRKTDAGFFGKARFLAAGSMGSGNALQPVGEDSIHPSYNGDKESLEDSLAKMEARKVYVMLGANDLAPYGVEGAAENLDKLVGRFLARLPSLKVYIQSATPLLPEKQMKTLNNPNLEKYDSALSSLCAKRGWNYVDVASVMRAPDGSLKREYCSDPDDLGMHFTDEACDTWIHYSLTHTADDTEVSQ